MRNNKKGFTLVELLVVIAILAILASVAVVGYTAFIEKAKDSNAMTEAHQLETSIESVIMIPGDAYVLGQVPGEDAVADDPATDDVDETAPAVPPVTYYVVKVNGAVIVTTDLDNPVDVSSFEEGFEFNDDIKALGGTLTYKGNGVFDFTSASEGKATITLD